MSESRRVRFEHARFGTVDAPESAALHCTGLPGFAGARTLLVVYHDKPSVFGWLVCPEIPDLALPVTDPWHHYPDYDPRPHHADLRAVGAKEGDRLELLVVANATAQGTFLNLAAPLIVNPDGRRAIQAILVTGDWPIRAPLQREILRPAAQIESNPQR